MTRVRIYKSYDKFNKNKDKNEEFTFVFARGDKKITKKLTADLICDYNVIYLHDDPQINAFADGKNLLIARGMFRFTESEEELALVISHELAHNTMQHIKKGKENQDAAKLGGKILDIFTTISGFDSGGIFEYIAKYYGSQIYSVEFEQEADYVGMYYFAKTGYETDQVANFWRRMAIENNSYTIDRRTSHPSNAERFIDIMKTHDEIQTKIVAGKDLTPESKEKPATNSKFNR